MKETRPIYLDLTTMKFPLMAICSILHRISGVLLFLLFPIMLYFWDMSLKNAGTFADLTLWLKECFFCKLTCWLFASAILYHLFAGLRHMVMDCGYGESVPVGRQTAAAVIGLAIMASLIVGIWLW